MQIYYHIIFAIMTFFLLLWIGYLYDKSKFIALLKDIRALRIMHYLLFFIFGLSVALNWSFDFSFFNYVEIFLCIVAITLACLFSLFTNNIADYKIDKISNQTRPSVTGLISNKEYVVLSVFALVFTIMFSVLVGYYIMFLSLVFIGVYFLYSMPPWRLKRVPVFSKLMIAFNTFVVFLMGHYYIEGNLDAPFEYKILILVFFGLAINFIDIKDYRGDKHAGIMTLPTLIGKRKSQYLIGLFFFLAHVSSFFIFDILEGLFILLLLLAFGVAQFYVVARRKYSEKPIFALYFVLFLILGVYLTQF